MATVMAPEYIIPANGDPGIKIYDFRNLLTEHRYNYFWVEAREDGKVYMSDVKSDIEEWFYDENMCHGIRRYPHGGANGYEPYFD